VTMDLLMVDLGENENVQIGDEVVLMGKQNNEEISIHQLSNKLNTIPYEIMCSISSRVPRIFTGENK